MKNQVAAYLKEKKLEKDLKLKTLSEKTGVSTSYLSDIMSGRRNPPSYEMIEKIATAFELNNEEKYRLYDLAGKETHRVSNDLYDYIMNDSNHILRSVLRKAIELKLEDHFWEKIEIMLENEKDYM